MRGPKMKKERNNIVPLLIMMFLLSLSLAAWAEEQAPAEQSAPEQPPAGEQPAAPQAEQPAAAPEEGPAFFTEEAANGGIEPEWEHVYHYPEIQPQYSLWGGYRVITLKGSERAAEFESLKDSVAFGGSIIAFPFPVRLHLELDVLTDEDYFSDLRFAYKDNIQVRILGRSFVHNLTNIEYPSDIDPGVNQLDEGERYGLRTQIYKAFVRYKIPNYPLHFFVDATEVDKKGDMQARFYTFAAKTTKRQEVDWNTTDVRLGVNSHLGPIEAELSHTERRFDSQGDVLSDAFGANVSIHHVIPDFEGSINELKLHTSYTGRVVASATFMTNDRENEFSNAEADYFIGAGHVRYLATDRLTLVLKYRHKDLDLDNSDLSFLNRTDITYMAPGPPACPGLTCPNRSISSETDTVTGIANYRLSKSLTLEANAIYKHVEREDEEDWELARLPDSTDETTLGLSATYRPVKGLKLRAKYAHLEIDDPAYNFQPNRSDSGSLSVSWTPVAYITGFLTYELAKEKRNDYVLMGEVSPEDPLYPEDLGQDRDVTRDKLTTSVTFLLGEKVTITPSFAYWHNKIKQDLLYVFIDHSPPIDPTISFPDYQVPYTDIARNYALALSYAPKERLNLGAEVSHTIARGNFYSNNPTAAAEPSIGNFSRLDISETIYSLSATYEIMKNTELGFDYSYTDFNTEENPLNPEDEDGIAQVILVSLTKRWL